MRVLVSALLFSLCLLWSPILRAETKSAPRASLLPRSPVSLATLGLNAFANERRFGSVRAQLQEVRSQLGIKYIRILFAWNDAVQPSSGASVNYSFYDEIARSIPAGTKALVVLTGIPSWVEKTGDEASRRSQFEQLWVEKTVARYARNGRIEGFQIWNEPNDKGNKHNALLGLQDPLKYLALLSGCRSFAKKVAPNTLVINAATTAIAQNYPETLRYNEQLLAGGITALTDRFAVHFYGQNYLALLFPGGVSDVLSEIDIPIWITESGRQGLSRQRQYVETVWPLLKREIPKIERFYFYQHTDERGTKNTTYGLRSKEGVSDFYRYLRGLKQKRVAN